ncbi:MAG TPA: helix-turn-helix domain-containing protein [Stellaceae bacterium]|nr:helix-turn-helix domain-containing protein [Stellaceae bacterium]
MQHKSFGEMSCPVARTLERVGDWWTILILRDAFHGLTRFDEFQKSLDIAPNILSRRLAALVEDGLLRRQRYQDHPPREEYVLTEKGRDFRSVVLAMLAWGNRHYAPDGKSVVLIDGETGREVDPVLVDPVTGRSVTEYPYRTVAGPAADERTRRRLATSAARSSDAAPAPKEPANV